MNSKRNMWIGSLFLGAAAAMLSPALHARDPGRNQPGALGNSPGVSGGAPGAGARDPGRNQPGAAGNTGPARRAVRRR